MGDTRCEEDYTVKASSPTKTNNEESVTTVENDGEEINHTDTSSVTQEEENDIILDISLAKKELGSARSSSMVSRIPTISARAAFTRTPIHKLVDDDGDQDGIPTSDDVGVLITELKASDNEEECTDEEWKPTVADEQTNNGVNGDDGDEPNNVLGDEPLCDPVTAETVEVLVTEEDYDTDLEIDEEEDEDVVKANYKTVCEQLGLVPVEYFLRHIKKTSIRMRYRGLGCDGMRAIALSLKDSIILERLDLCGNWIGAEGARFMGRLLEENDYLTDITISDNKIGSEGCHYLAKMIGINGGLRRLDISGNEFDDNCAEALSVSLENNRYLRELNLSHNKFTECGAEFLGQAISGNENLEKLDLSWNHLREKGGIAVAKGIKENVRLKVCNLSWNGLGVRGGLAVADAMLVNQSLLEIDICGNRLTLVVANTMAKVLTTNDTIKALRIGNNLITSAGAIALASAINNTDNCEMEELDLTDIPVEYEFIRIVEDIKGHHPEFTVKYGALMRAGNTIDDISRPAIDVDRIKKEPVVILKEHIMVNDMRLLDILKRYDEDNTLSITAEDFITAVEELAVPYDRKRLEESVQKLAATGKIYFGSFVQDDYQAKIQDCDDS